MLCALKHGGLALPSAVRVSAALELCCLALPSALRYIFLQLSSAAKTYFHLNNPARAAAHFLLGRTSSSFPPAALFFFAG